MNTEDLSQRTWEERFQELCKEMDAWFEKISTQLSRIECMLEDITLTFEEEVQEVIQHRLRRFLGIDAPLQLVESPKALQVEIYGVKDNCCVIGEASVRVNHETIYRLIARLLHMHRATPERLRLYIIPVVYGLQVTEDAVEAARRYGVWIATITENLTPPQKISLHRFLSRIEGERPELWDEENHFLRKVGHQDGA